MKTVTIITIFFLFLTVIHTANACSCIEPLPPSESLEEAETVFSGVVLSKRVRHDTIKVTFKVSCAWKGELKEKITVYTAIQSATCGFSFQRGREYLVYAHKNQFFSTKLTTNLCTRTKELSGADEDILELGEGNCFN